MEASKENIEPSSEVISCLINITGMTQDEIVHHFKADGVLSTSRHEYILQLLHSIEKGWDTFGTIEAFRAGSHVKVLEWTLVRLISYIQRLEFSLCSMNLFVLIMA